MDLPPQKNSPSDNKWLVPMILFWTGAMCVILPVGHLIFWPIELLLGSKAKLDLSEIIFIPVGLVLLLIFKHFYLRPKS